MAKRKIINKLSKLEPDARQVFWFGMVLVILSIAFSTAVIWLGTDDMLPKVLTFPQALFAAGVILYKFVK